MGVGRGGGDTDINKNYSMSDINKNKFILNGNKTIRRCRHNNKELLDLEKKTDLGTIGNYYPKET